MSMTVQVLEPEGILDSSKAERFRQTVNDLPGEAEVLLLDLKDVTFIDSSGLGILVVILKQLRTAGRRLCICSINDQVKMLFELTSMNQVFEVFDDRDAFEAEVLSQSGSLS
ncbi:sulfate transporter [filamentous cyanobacterium CCP5]|nr:sulfate transporter [filamentous cyanobacterium CCP5]